MRKFSTFFRANYSLVVGVAERRLDSKADAEEVASEAFRLAWQRYEDGEALRGESRSVVSFPAAGFRRRRR
ncbi:MAG: sigma factor [Microbacterium sp.]